MTHKERITRKFTKDFRVSAVKLIFDEKMSISKAAYDLGVSSSTLHGWVRRFRKGTWDLNQDAKGLKSTEYRKLSHLESQAFDKEKIQDLERQLKRLTMERDILKKAIAYCIELPK